MSQAPTTEPVLPAGLRYRIVVPLPWVCLPANPVAMRKAARRHLEERFASLPRDRTIQVRRQLEDHLVRLADRASSQFAVDLLLLAMEVEQRPVSASCLVSLVPMPLHDEDQLRQFAQMSADGASSSEVVELGANRGVRVVRHQEPDPDTMGDLVQPAGGLPPEQGEQQAPPRHGASRVVDYFVPVPDGAAVVLFSFATPVKPLFDVLTGLFDAMVSTLQWKTEGASWS